MHHGGLVVTTCQIQHASPSTHVPCQWIAAHNPACVITWVDFTKTGTLGTDLLEDAMEEIRRICGAHPNKSCAIVVPPYLTSAKVASGKRWEFRTASYCM